MKDLEKVLEELKERNIDIIDLEIANEINCQLDYIDRIFTDDEREKILYYVRRAYLKSEDLSIERITRTAIDKIDELDKIGVYNLIDYACYY